MKTRYSAVMPAAWLEDLGKRDREVLENRIKHGNPIAFRTSTGVILKLSWSVQFCEFRISNGITVASTYTAKAAYRFISHLNQMPEIKEAFSL